MSLTSSGAKDGSGQMDYEKKIQFGSYSKHSYREVRRKLRRFWQDDYELFDYQLIHHDLKRTPLQRRTPLKRHTKLRIVGVSDTAQIKERIQGVARDIVMARDGGCIFRAITTHICSGWAKDGHLILQADHLISRANSATFGDTRLIVCVFQGIHGWKSVGGNMRKKQYDEVVRTFISPERVKLWDTCEQESWRPHRTSAMDWKLTLAALEAELHALQAA